MKTTPKALRLQIGIFGRTNVGKSSFLNLIAGQDVAITSPIPGTTTDVVEKSMELLPVGPVVFLDTAGLDDVSELADRRIAKTKKIFDRADVITLIVEPDTWDAYEDDVSVEAKKRSIPVIAVINKTDLRAASGTFQETVRSYCDGVMSCSSIDLSQRDVAINEFKKLLLGVHADEILRQPPLIADLVPPGRTAVFVVPIDLQAPKGRLILPQVQAIRDVLDGDGATLVVKEREYAHALQQLREVPAIVACDSQAVLKVVADTPPAVPCTTFSILFSRHRGDLLESVRGSLAIDELAAGDNVLIAEACSHHAIEDDIGRVKIPRWLRQYVGADLKIDVASGRDYPEDLSNYKLIIHCGGCMITRREMLTRIEAARREHVPIVNYGVAIAFLQGVLERALSPFPAALEILRCNRGLKNRRKGNTACQHH